MTLGDFLLGLLALAGILLLVLHLWMEATGWDAPDGRSKGLVQVVDQQPVAATHQPDSQDSEDFDA